MINKPVEEGEKAPASAALASSQQKIEKQARQLAYDTRYQVKKEIGGKKVDPASMKRLLLQRLQKSSAAPAIKLRAKQMLLGEDYIADSQNLAAETIASAMFKVFVEGVKVEQEIELNYLKELDEKKERKYKVRVTDKKTRNSYVRYATREKISELRANPNILSVEITEYGEPREGEKKQGASTAKAKSGKGLDPVGQEDKDIDNDGDHDKTDKYLLKRRKAIGNAIATRKEEFIADAAGMSADPDANTRKITGLKAGESNKIVVFPNDSTTDRQGTGSAAQKGIFAHTELEGEVISETGYQKFLTMLQEKAESEQQQKLFGLALSVKRGETPRSEVSAEVLKIVDTMSEKKIRDFAKTKHKGLPKKKVQKEAVEPKSGGSAPNLPAGVVKFVDELPKTIQQTLSGAKTKPSKPVNPVKEESECGCDDEPKMKERENDTEDMRGVKTKVNLVKNKLRSMGLKMSYEPEGEDIHEIPLVVAAPLVAGGLYAAGKGIEALKGQVNKKIDSARKNTAIGGDRRVPQMNSYQPEGEVVEERKPEVEEEGKRVAQLEREGRGKAITDRFRQRHPGSRQPKRDPGAKETESEKQRRLTNRQVARVVKYGLTKKEKEESKAREPYNSARD
jgi:hypothetical protein